MKTKTDKLDASWLGKKVQTEDCPPDYFLVVTEILPATVDRGPGFRGRDVLGIVYAYHNPKIGWMEVSSQCICPFLRRSMQNPQAIIQACPEHAFKVYQSDPGEVRKSDYFQPLGDTVRPA